MRFKVTDVPHSQSKVAHEKKANYFPPCWSFQRNTCRMQSGCTIPLKTGEKPPFQQQTVPAQVHESYNRKTKKKKQKEKHIKIIH